MKKLMILLVAVMPLVFAGCNHKNKSSKLSEADSLKIELQVDSIMKSKLAGVKDASKDSLGIWEVQYYVDEFGDKTDAGYIFGVAVGEFSNSATQNSHLVVHFLIDNEDDISIQLYEYGGNNPVKSGSESGYWIKIKNENNETETFSAMNYQDRLVIYDKEEAKQLYNYLQKGGKLSFSIREISKYSESTYRFTIPETKGIDKALLLIKK